MGLLLWVPSGGNGVAEGRLALMFLPPTPLQVLDRTFAPAGQVVRSLVSTLPGTIPHQPHLFATHPAAVYVPSGQAAQPRATEEPPDSTAAAAATASARELHKDLMWQLSGLGVGALVGFYLAVRCK